MTVEFDQFQAWLVVMDDAISAFIRTLPKGVADKLDFSADSIDTLEKLILESYPSVDAARASAEARRVDAMARYLGEVFRKHFGGKWKIDHSDRKNAFHGLPQLAGMKGQNVQFCPLALVTATTHRRTGSFIRRLFENYQRDAA